VLKNRGWKDRGRLCNPEDVNELYEVAEGKRGRLYSRCLWWVDEDDGRKLKPLSSTVGQKHGIATFIGTDAATTKVAITEMLNGKDFYPTSFVLPKQNKALVKFVKSNPNSYWMSKPKNDYAGNGCVAYHANQKMFKEILKVKEGKEFVVQRYIHKPFLISKYKFHFRMYTILVGVDPFKAYLFRNGKVLFSTKPFTLRKSTLGENFDVFVHLTNRAVNFCKGNIHLPQRKPGVGVGCEWTVRKMLRVTKKAHPEFDEKGWWKQLSHICAETMYAISKWKHVQRHKKLNKAHPRVGVFGLDLIMDTKFKVFLMEANSQPGLSLSPDRFPDERCEAKICTRMGCKFCKGAKNPQAKHVNSVSQQVVSASLDVLQLDCEKRDMSKTLITLHDIVE